MYTYIQVFCIPPNFPSGENLYQTLPFFVIFMAVSPQFKSHNGKIWREGVDLGLPPASQILQKSLKGIYPFLVNLYQKIPTLAIWGLYCHIFEPTMMKLSVTVRTCDSLPQAIFCKKNRLREYTLLGKCIPKITNFGVFGGCKPTF